jgi:prepilin-type N-terminal cleavage/methylation domain-containing protein
MLKFINNKRGLSLIELLITLALLSFVIIGFLNLFVYGVSYIGMARNKNTSSIKAQSDANGYMSVNIGENITTTDKTVVTTDKGLDIFLVTGSSINVTVSKITVIITDKDQESKITTIITKED